MKLFYTSTLFGALTLAAALDTGRFGGDGERRVLIVSNNAAIPEITPGPDTSPWFEPLRGYFDEVVPWNPVLAPLHPSGWSPRGSELPMLQRLLADHLRLHEPVSELVVESIAVAPARTFARLLPDAPITVYSDGLMSYGPTRDALPVEIGDRVTRVLHLDVVPGLQPLLLREFGVEYDAIAGKAFRAVLERVAAAAPVPDVLSAPVGDAGPGPAMLVGQYLSVLGIMTATEETALYAQMLGALVSRGHRHVLFKAHPAAGAAHALALRAVARDLGVELVVVPESVPAELCFDVVRPELVVGAFSTALLTAHTFYDLPVATMGGELILERLTPYENSNRIPATIVDAMLPELDASGTVRPSVEDDPSALVEAVSYCMQARQLEALRPVAAAYLAEHGGARYFKRKRLIAIGLMDAPPVRPSTRPSAWRDTRPGQAARQAVRTGRATVERLRRGPDRH